MLSKELNYRVTY